MPVSSRSLSTASALLVVLVLVGLSSLPPSSTLARAARITKLPGLATLPSFAMHSGYIEVNRTSGRHLFYWHCEASDVAPADAPLVVWQTGGPGCSSLMGMFTENGPFNVSADGTTLAHREHAWNRRANVVWVESPAGVGFSYATRADGYVTGDNQTAADMLAFVLGLYKLFPQYRTRPLFLTGESYGGHYLPMLATAILDHNAPPRPAAEHVPLRGIFLGNPWTDDRIDAESIPQWQAAHTLAPRRAWTRVVSDCHWSGRLLADTGDDAGARATLRSPRFDFDTAPRLRASTSECQHALDALAGDVDEQHTNDLNIYAYCWTGKSSLVCSNYEAVVRYFNTLATQKAIHARTDLAWRWSPCTENAQFRYVHSLPSMVPLWPRIIAALERVAIYSGDITWNCNTFGTQRWIDSLNMTEVRAWQSYFVDGQLAGYSQHFAGNFSLVTVKDAGHMVPQDKPTQAAFLFNSFLNGTLP